MWEVDVEMGKPESSWPSAVTLVLAAGNARQRRWTGATAIEIARRIGEGKKVILADVGARTRLGFAKSLGVQVSEGIVDVLFRGASFSSVARRPEAESFFFLTVGSAPPPLPVLYHHPRWQKIAARLAAADAHLLACVAAEDWLEAGPIPGFEACVVLNALGDEVELPSGARRLAEFLAPPEIREEVAPPELETVEPAPSPPWKEYSKTGGPAGVEPGAQLTASAAALARIRGRSSFVRHAGGLAGMKEFLLPRLGILYPASVRRILSSPRARSVVPAVGLVVAVSFVVALWSVLRNGEAPGDGRVGLEAAAGTPAASAGAPEPGRAMGARPRETSLPYSVAIASYSSFDDALVRQGELAQAGLPVYVAPTPVRGVVYYRVLVGMLPERAQAETLMAELVSAGVKDTLRSWDVRPVRLAFGFGVFPGEPEARAVVASLLDQGVPAYVVPAAAAAGDESLAYRVYAGGFESPEDSGPLATLIRRAGLDSDLVERVGWVPQ
jgi:cell division septation protein DedD